MRSAMGIPDCAFLPYQGRTRRVVLLLAPGQRQQGSAASLPAGSPDGLVVAGPAGIFVYADSRGGAFTFAANATSFRADNGSRGSLDDLKIVPGRAAMLAANAVSTQTVN